MADATRSTEEIQRDIERVRDDLARDVTALEISVRHTLDWRRPIRERPIAFAGGALALGFVLGLI